MLLEKDFKYTIENIPLISLDLIIKNKKREILLGLRNNSPAKGYYFVPGGRIFKNEQIKDSIKRISKNEFGFEITNKDITIKGVYDHIYKNGDNFLNNVKFNTHYIVICCEYKYYKDIDLNKLPKEQHSNYKFMSNNDLIKDDKVHYYVKNYFLENPSNLFVKL